MRGRDSAGVPSRSTRAAPKLRYYSPRRRVNDASSFWTGTWWTCAVVWTCSKLLPEPIPAAAFGWGILVPRRSFLASLAPAICDFCVSIRGCEIDFSSQTFCGCHLSNRPVWRFSSPAGWASRLRRTWTYELKYRWRRYCRQRPIPQPRFPVGDPSDTSSTARPPQLCRSSCKLNGRCQPFWVCDRDVVERCPASSRPCKAGPCSEPSTGGLAAACSSSAAAEVLRRNWI